MPRPAPQIDSTIHVVTPENIAFRYYAAGPFRRLPAYLIDLAIRAFLCGLLYFAGAMVAFTGVLAGFSFVFLGWFVLQWFYGGFFETFMNGQTLGKRVMGIRVLTIDGRPINGMQAVMRNLLRFADLMPMVSVQVLEPLSPVPLPPLYLLPTYMLGLLVMSLSPKYQRLGDLVCGTMVVVEERHWLTGVAKIEDTRAFQLAGLLPADLKVSRSLASAMSHYVERRRFFSTQRRREVAAYLGAPLTEQYGLPPDTSHDLLLCALYYRTFIADRNQDEKHIAEANSPFMQTGSPHVPTATPVTGQIPQAISAQPPR